MGAQAAECAADQRAFWPYHDRLFSEASRAGANGFTADRLIQYANELGLDDQQLSRCIISQTQAQAIRDSLAEGYAIPINSTPSILINGIKIENPFDYAALTAEIDRLLAETN